jgi:DNA-binding FrmR family transcriptional regulator
MRGRRAAALSWVLAVLSAMALAIAGLLTYADHTLFSSDAFADRAAATLEAQPVRDAAARRLTDVVVGVHPDLVALRPILELGARAAVGTPQFRSLVRRAALDAHRSAFDAHSRALTFQIRDAGLLAADVVRRLSPGVADRMPTRVITRVARIKGGVHGIMLSLAEHADRARVVRWIALATGLVLALAALLVTDSRRASVLRLGLAVAAVAAVVALVAALAPALAADSVGSADRDAVRAALDVWLDPITAWAVAAGVAGVVVALAAAAVVRPIPVMALVRRAGSTLVVPPRSGVQRVLRAGAALAAGAIMVLWPRAVLGVVIVALGALLALAALAELLAFAAGPAGRAARAPRARGPGMPRAVRIGAVALLATVGVAVAAVLAGGDGPAIARVGRCNGHAALCDRRVDQVAFLATHNAMAAPDEPGWLFAAQDAGIPEQLDDGVRALMIDTQYGIGTPRGVATQITGENTSRAKLVAEVGERFVATAQRIGTRIGRNPKGQKEVYLCHTLCEVGATRAADALRSVHRFLVRHPEEVVVLSIQDETSAADTAAVIRASGLADEVYLGPAGRPWPTLRELIDRDERVIVLAENHTGAAPWVHHQPSVVQETPFLFRSVAALEAPTSCEPNRGGTAGSLLLVNHWVDTPPAPRVSIARRVNAHDFLTSRVARCRETRGMFPNLISVDFYRQGDAARVVDELNRVG